MSYVARLKRTGSQNKTNYYNNKLVEHFKPVRGEIAELEEDTPSGSIIAYTGSVDPRGWMICDGRTISIQDHESLYAVISTQFGGDGVYTFRLPDLRGSFLRGTGTNAAYTEYAGSSLNSIQTHATQVHHHQITDPTHNHGITDPSHNHGITDPGHYHTQNGGGSTKEGVTSGVASEYVENDGTSNTASAQTGITINYASTGITVNNHATGITINDVISTDTNVAGNPPVRLDNKETRPFNLGINWIIKM